MARIDRRSPHGRGEKPTVLNFAHDTLLSLTESVKTGCETCRMLLGSLEIYRNPK